MSGLDRREFLALTGAAASQALLPETAWADAAPSDFDHAYSVLYDATRCIGCRACSRRCSEAHQLPAEVGKVDDVAFDMPRDLSANNLMVLQAYRRDTSTASPSQSWTFVKRNCMHCNVPACASACPVAALRKTKDGPVVYDESRCIGCRYCMLACPYGVPRYEWMNRMPRVRKCHLDGACVKACPVGALVDGKRGELISEAHKRIGEAPDRYVDHVYGEHEAGGTSYLILSAIPLEQLGFPKLAPFAHGAYAAPILSAVPGWIVGLGLFLGAVYELQRRQRRAEVEASYEKREAM
jgi:formate dehydrogenase iron-sulfur subunit